jgi:hypothetical protein
MTTDLVTRSSDEDQPDLATELRAIAQESVSLMTLGYQLANRVNEALALVEPAPVSLPDPETVPPRILREFGIAYLAAASSKQLRADIVEARGTQSACVLATKLDTDLIALGKQRPVVQGRDGNGAAHV